MKYIQGEAFETAAVLWATLNAGGHVYFGTLLRDPAAMRKIDSITVLAALADGRIYHAIPAPEPVRCPACHATMERRQGADLHTCQRCGCSFMASKVKPCPDCAKANAERDNANAERDEAIAERDDYKDRCYLAERYITQKRGDYVGMSHAEMRYALAILRGEDQE